jgi:hypothetical protein
MLSMIQTALRANIADSAERVGPFLLQLRVSRTPAEPSGAAIADLVTAFTRRARRPRLEYVAPAPGVSRRWIYRGRLTSAHEISSKPGA